MKLKPYRTSYDGANAYWMARLARAVYTTRDGSAAPNEDRYRRGPELGGRLL